MENSEDLDRTGDCVYRFAAMSDRLERVNILMATRRYGEAISQLREAVAEDPLNPETRLALARAYFEADKPSAALVEAREALRLEPNDAETHWILAAIFTSLEDDGAAEKSARESVQLAPWMSQSHGMLAKTLYHRSKHQEALHAAETGLGIDPDCDMCRTFRARALSSLGRHEEADQAALGLLEDDPEDSWNHILRGDQYLRAGEAEKARTHFLEALRLEPGNESARSGLAYALKARSPFFSKILRLLMWTDNFRAAHIWMVFGVLLVLMIFGGRLVEGNPDLELAHSGLMKLVQLATVLLFIANPVFNLLLRFSPEGRHVLSEDETRASNWHVVCFVLAGLCAYWNVASGGRFLPGMMALSVLYFCWFVTQYYETRPGSARRWMRRAIVSAAILLVLVPLMPVAGILLLLSPGFTWLGAFLLKNFLHTIPVIILVSVFSDDLRRWIERRTGASEY